VQRLSALLVCVLWLWGIAIFFSGAQAWLELRRFRWTQPAWRCFDGFAFIGSLFNLELSFEDLCCRIKGLQPIGKSWVAWLLGFDELFGEFKALSRAYPVGCSENSGWFCF
jgi:hypothetical protein